MRVQVEAYVAGRQIFASLNLGKGIRLNYKSLSFRFVAGFLASALLLAPAVSLAHIKNESSQFPDIEFSDSRFDIVVLVGAGIIPETPVFEPDLPMSQQDLAIWAALYNNLGPGGETPDTDALAKAALAAGLVESFDGQATYADINALFFAGQLAPELPDATPTRAEAASYIASMLSLPAGESLLEKRGLQVGPVGDVVNVESRVNPDGGSSYYITVADMTLPMYAHGRVANGPTDLLLWQGRSIRRSFIRKQGDFNLWMYVEAAPLEAATLATGGTDVVEMDPMSAVQTDRNLLYGLLAGVLALGLVLFFKRKRVG